MELHPILSPSQIPLEEVHRLLKQTDWAQNRPAEVTEKAMAGSLCFALQTGDGRLAAFARVVTDGILFGYLADVVVDEACRHQGVGKQLLAHIMSHPVVKNFVRFALLTGDAQSFYSQFGFRPTATPDWWMEIFNPPKKDD